jgi:hypothetical protein
LNENKKARIMMRRIEMREVDKKREGRGLIREEKMTKKINGGKKKNS